MSNNLPRRRHILAIAIASAITGYAIAYCVNMLLSSAGEADLAGSAVRQEVANISILAIWLLVAIAVGFVIGVTAVISDYKTCRLIRYCVSGLGLGVVGFYLHTYPSDVALDLAVRGLIAAGIGAGIGAVIGWLGWYAGHDTHAH